MPFSNAIVHYNYLIKTGEEITSRKVKLVYEELVENIINNPKSKYEYDEAKANHAIEFIERYCKHSKGSMGGKPFILELWQKALVSAMFGIVDKVDGLRKYQEVILIVGRKNGKSTLSAAIGLYLMIADGELGPELYSVARMVATLNRVKSVKAKFNI